MKTLALVTLLALSLNTTSKAFADKDKGDGKGKDSHSIVITIIKDPSKNCEIKDKELDEEKADKCTGLTGHELTSDKLNDLVAKKEITIGYTGKKFSNLEKSFKRWMEFIDNNNLSVSGDDKSASLGSLPIQMNSDND